MENIIALYICVHNYVDYSLYQIQCHSKVSLFCVCWAVSQKMCRLVGQAQLIFYSSCNAGRSIYAQNSG
jgi:hypothetical protein